MVSVRIQEGDFDPTALTAELRQRRHDVGAIATFVGLVRDANVGSEVSGLALEHYPGMTEKAIEAIISESKARWDVIGASVVHRVGALAPGDQIVFVGVASAHRHDAFQACAYIMDYLKTKAPFWKKETRAQGTYWVESRASDAEAARRWSADGGVVIDQDPP